MTPSAEPIQPATDAPGALDAAITPIYRDCVQDHIIRRQSHELDAAHTKIREIEAETARLAALLAQTGERLAQLEGQSGQHTRLIEVISGKIDAIGLKYDSIVQHLTTLEEVVRNTNTLLLDRLTRSKAEANADHVERLKEIEKITFRLVKITGFLSLIVFVLSALWKIAFGPGLSALFSGFTP
jgi:uncharacterized protein YhaN